MFPHDTMVILFAKCPTKGIAKSRIAETMGERKAQQIYEELMEVVKNVLFTVPHCISYQGESPSTLKRLFPQSHYFYRQKGATLGEILTDSFYHFFSLGYKKLIAIGTDCPYLTQRHLLLATKSISSSSVVIGPAVDGGYYLIGCQKEGTKVFTAKKWSTEELLTETIEIIEKNRLTYTLLETLPDIDYEEDYKKWKVE